MKKSCLLISIVFVFCLACNVFAADTKVAVILSGCGVFDGSEVQEAVVTLLCLDQQGAKTTCFAPDKAQADVVNHVTGEKQQNTRNTMVEAARIARGDIKPLADLDVNQFDAIILPGGLGAGKNLSDFMEKSTVCSVDAELEKILKAANRAGKPLGFICLSPIIAARVFGPQGVVVTMGNNQDLTTAANTMQATTKPCTATQICVDDKNKIYSTPAYIEATSISELYEGINALVKKVLENTSTNQ